MLNLFIISGSLIVPMQSVCKYSATFNLSYEYIAKLNIFVVLKVVVQFQDCTDGTDESNCTAVSCPDDKFNCPQVTIIIIITMETLDIATQGLSYTRMSYCHKDITFNKESKCQWEFFVEKCSDSISEFHVKGYSNSLIIIIMSCNEACLVQSV